MMPCNGQSINLNITNSRSCRIYVQSKNIKDISSAPMSKDYTTTPLMHSEKGILGKKENDVDNENICKDNFNGKKMFPSTQDCTEFQIDKDHVFPFPKNGQMLC